MELHPGKSRYKKNRFKSPISNCSVLYANELLYKNALCVFKREDCKKNLWYQTSRRKLENNNNNNNNNNEIT